MIVSCARFLITQLPNHVSTDINNDVYFRILKRVKEIKHIFFKLLFFKHGYLVYYSKHVYPILRTYDPKRSYR